MTPVSKTHRPQEYGFWVYVGPQTGGVEGYREQDWNILLDDVAEMLRKCAAGQGNLVINIGPQGDGSIPPKR